MPTLTTHDGATIAFTDEGSGVPVVLVPGICCSQRWWEPQRRELAGPLRLISLDLRGVGASPRVAHGHRVVRYGADVAELIDWLDLRDVVLVGWSLGYSVSLGAIELAGQERVAGLVLVEGSPRLLNDATWALGFADLEQGARMRAAFVGDWQRTIEALVRGMFSRPAEEPALAELRADALRADPGSTAQLFWDHLNQDWRDVLPTITVPTLVVAGGGSAIGDSVGAAEYAAAAIADARLELFENSGHALFREQPDRFNALLRDFAEECASA